MSHQAENSLGRGSTLGGVGREWGYTCKVEKRGGGGGEEYLGFYWNPDLGGSEPTSSPHWAIQLSPSGRSLEESPSLPWTGQGSQGDRPWPTWLGCAHGWCLGDSGIQSVNTEHSFRWWHPSFILMALASQLWVRDGPRSPSPVNGPWLPAQTRQGTLLATSAHLLPLGGHPEMASSVRASWESQSPGEELLVGASRPLCPQAYPSSISGPQGRPWRSWGPRPPCPQRGSKWPGSPHS